MAAKDGIILDIVDENDRVIGQAARKEIHKKGLLHREIHVWFITPRGEIIFQHRAKDKDTFPDLLDATVGGHVEQGGSYEETALKEMKEETGIDGDLKDLHNTIRAQYAYMFQGDIKDLRIEKGRALGFETWPIDALSHLSLENKRKFIPLILGDDMLSLFKKMKALIGVN
jgi:isopentenyldiphosphate isomerase